MERLVVASLSLIALAGCASQPAPPDPPPEPGVSARIHPAWNGTLSRLLAGNHHVESRGAVSGEEFLARQELPPPPQVASGRARPASPLQPTLPWGDPMAPTGNVVAIRLDLEPAWVLIDVGASHDVQAGQIFEVRRYGAPVARFVLDEVIAWQSAGRVLDAADAREVRLGDTVHYVGLERPRAARGDHAGWPGVPVPSIRASVLATKGEASAQLVLLDVGVMDRVEPGFHFSVYRGAQFVAKVVVERVLRDSSGCRVLFAAEGQRVEPGDAAATRLE